MSEARQCNCQELSSEVLAILLGIDADHIKLILGEATEEKKGEICQKWEDYHKYGIEMTKELDELFANLCQQHKGLCPQSGPEMIIKEDAPVIPEVTKTAVGNVEIGDWVSFRPDSALMTVEKIEKGWVTLKDGQGNLQKILVSQQVYQPLKPSAIPKLEIREREARYGFLQLNEAEYNEALKSGRYPEPTRYEKLTGYYTEPHEPGWKGLSLAEMFPTKYKELLKRGVPDKLSPFEVKTVIEEKRIPYGRGVEQGVSEAVTPEVAQEARGLRVMIGNIEDQIAKGVTSPGMTEQLRLAKTRLAEIEKVTRVDITKGVIKRGKELIANPDNIPAARAFIAELRRQADEAEAKALTTTESKAGILNQNARQARRDADRIEQTIPAIPKAEAGMTEIAPIKEQGGAHG